jgi:hypothetical protein
VDIINTSVRPALAHLGENQTIIVPSRRAKSPRIEVKRLAASAFPWLAQVTLNRDAVLCKRPAGCHLTVGTCGSV